MVMNIPTKSLSMPITPKIVRTFGDRVALHFGSAPVQGKKQIKQNENLFFSSLKFKLQRWQLF